jgi:hypothetical protein
MNHLLTKLTATVASSLAFSMILANSAQAITLNFNWQGNAGYSATGVFGYDENTAPAIISESGAGPTNTLEFLTVSFFDPANNPLQSFNTVNSGVSQSPFFNFNFNTATQTLFGAFDVGGGTGVIGEQFLQGTIGGLLELKQDVNQIGTSIVLDSQNPGVVTVTQQTPEATSSLGLLALGVLGITSSLIKKQK